MGGARIEVGPQSLRAGGRGNGNVFHAEPQSAAPPSLGKTWLVRLQSRNAAEAFAVLLPLASRWTILQIAAICGASFVRKSFPV